jgi:hypothetical protein
MECLERLCLQGQHPLAGMGRYRAENHLKLSELQE